MADSKLWYLMNMDIFKGLSKAEYALIDKDSKTLNVKRKESIPFQGTAEHNIYFLKRGKIKLVKLSPEGRAITLDILNEGTLFGEVNGILAGHGEDVVAEAMEDCYLCSMKKNNFDHLMSVVPALSKRIIKVIGLRFKKIENKLVDLLYSTVEERLAKTFLSLYKDFGAMENGKPVIKIKLTHNDLAELVASTRETVSAVISDFKHRGIIDQSDKYIIIADEAKLGEIASRAQ